MISKAIINEYANREFDEYDWVKHLDFDTLYREIKTVDPGFKFYEHAPDPYIHQLACFLLGMNLRNFLFFLDMGTGKSRILLDLLLFHRRNSNLFRTLICVPRNANIKSWLDEIDIWRPELSCISLAAEGDERWERLQEDKNLYLSTYIGLQPFMATLDDEKEEKNGKIVPRKRKRDESYTRLFASYFDSIVMDELHKFCGNTGALSYRICRQLTKKAKVRYAATGTPFGKDPQRIWPQYNLIDDGKTLGATQGIFREYFYIKTKNIFSGGYDYKFNQKLKPTLNRWIKNRSIVYADTECQSIPPIVYITKAFKLPASSVPFYNKLADEQRKAFGNYEVMKNSFIRMRQVCSGFIGAKDDDTGAKIQIELAENPKLELIEEIINGIPENEKGIIFNEFIYSGDMICKLLTKLKIPFLRLYSGTKDQIKVYTEFKDPASKYKWLVANSDTGGTGLNLQIAHYTIVYESTIDPITRRQLEKRTQRGGQEAEHVFIYDLLAEGSVEVDNVANLKEGRSLMDAIMRGEYAAQQIR